MAALLKGTAFITGAASGIGKATAAAFAQYGIRNLALTDIDLPTLEAAGKELVRQFPHVQLLTRQVDVSQTDSVQKALAATVNCFGRLDVAVNNAGVAGSGKRTHETPEDDWRRVISVNLDGVWRCQKEELRIMLEQEDRGPRQGRGRIINMASMFGVVSPSTTYQTAYSTAKHGILGMTRSDAIVYGSKGIRINCICPGYVSTPLFDKHLEDFPDTPLLGDVTRTPLGRMAELEEIADATVFLASTMSSFIQGTALVADGGFSVQ